ncbi:MAG: heavy metal-responsive transcriptional regulator, partial [Candidatus Methylomirabilis sp.]|nr:heavy metal-responsive transcriptional regulator [Deltaproteobacteria bacterium]
VARESRVNVETVRFYERKGLVARPAREGGGFRKYPREVVRRIRFIRSGKALGFTLKEIEELLALRVSGATRCEDVRRRAEKKIRTIDEKLRELERMKRALEGLTAACRGKRKTSACPILDALGEREGEP